MSDDEGDIAVTFETTRGTFDVPAELFEDGREHELSVHFAKSLPPGKLTLSRKLHRDGSVSITWRRIRIVPDIANAPAVRDQQRGRSGLRFIP